MVLPVAARRVKQGALLFGARRKLGGWAVIIDTEMSKEAAAFRAL
jgi:hypothetical protein